MIEFSRRQLIGAGAAAGAMLLLPVAAGAAGPAITTWRDPGCGCCGKWAEAMRKAGFAVTVNQTSDIQAVKRRLKVPDALASCHTSLVGGYVVEGHVPAATIAKLLKARPRDVAGIAVPGMSRGSPGMEMPDGLKDPLTVTAFTRTGKRFRFA